MVRSRREADNFEAAGEEGVEAAGGFGGMVGCYILGGQVGELGA